MGNNSVLKEYEASANLVVESLPLFCKTYHQKPDEYD